MILYDIYIHHWKLDSYSATVLTLKDNDNWRYCQVGRISAVCLVWSFAWKDRWPEVQVCINSWDTVNILTRWSKTWKKNKIWLKNRLQEDLLKKNLCIDLSWMGAECEDIGVPRNAEQMWLSTWQSLRWTQLENGTISQGVSYLPGKSCSS